MKRKLFTLLAAGILIPLQITAAPDCHQLNQIVVSQVANGDIKEPEAALSKTLASSSIEPESICSGLMLTDLAAIMLNTGRLARAETIAERAVIALEKAYSNDPVFLRPLQILCSARLQQGKIGAARQAFERMRSIPVVRPEDRALVHGLAAPLLVAEGKDRDAEAEFLAGIAALDQAGRGRTADTATGFGAIGCLYIQQHRFEEARRALDRAGEIFIASKDTVRVSGSRAPNRPGHTQRAFNKLRNRPPEHPSAA